MDVSTIKEKVKLSKKELLMMGCGMGVSTALLAIGFKTGMKFSEAKLSLGIQALWDADPSLKEQMWNAVAKVNEKK